MANQISRRAFLGGVMAGLAATVAGCSKDIKWDYTFSSPGIYAQGNPIRGKKPSDNLDYFANLSFHGTDSKDGVLSIDYDEGKSEVCVFGDIDSYRTSFPIKRFRSGTSDQQVKDSLEQARKYMLSPQYQKDLNEERKKLDSEPDFR